MCCAGKFERYEDDAEPQAHGGRKGGQQHQGKGGGASSYEMEEQLTSREAQLDRRELNSRQAELDMREQASPPVVTPVETPEGTPSIARV